MSRSNWKLWIVGNDDVNQHGILMFLRDIEDFFLRMIRGIVAFLVERVPKFFRVMLDWLHAKFVLSVRIAVRLVRVGIVVISWLAIVFGPITLYPGIVSVNWMVLALIGSVWGLRRQLKVRATRVKAASPAPVGLIESGVIAH